MPPKKKSKTNPARPASRLVQRPTTTKQAPSRQLPKQRRPDGSASSPYTISSDEEGLGVSAVPTKRTKTNTGSRPLHQVDNDGSSDDMPLIKRAAARKAAQKTSSKVPFSTPARLSKETRHPASPDPSAAISTPLQLPIRLSPLGSRPPRDIPTPSPTQRLVYGRQIDLSSDFKSAASDSPPTPAVMSRPEFSSLASGLPPCDSNKPQSMLPDLPKQEGTCSAKQRMKSRSKSKSKARLAEPKRKVKKRLFQEDLLGEDDADMADDEGVDLHERELGSEVLDDAEAEGSSDIEVIAESEVGMFDSCEDESAASQPAADRTRVGFECRHVRSREHARPHLPPAPASATPTVRVSRAARTTPAVSSPTALQRSAHASAAAVPRSSTTVSDLTTRESAFLSGFNTRWWPGGFPPRTAVIEVNAALRRGIVAFPLSSGKEMLHSLAEKGHVIIREDMVYHLDQDPGDDEQ